MTKKAYSREKTISNFILSHVADNSTSIVKLTASRFGISRQAANKYLQALVSAGALSASGHTKNKTYQLVTLLKWTTTYPITSNLEEHSVWVNDIKPLLGDLPKNVLDIWHYGFTEMFNNAIDHSEGSTITVIVEKNAAEIDLFIVDNGVGIFKKLQTELNLIDQRHALLELAKGKLTTDPQRHTGEGIFFSSRMFKRYGILSGEVFFSHLAETPQDWLFETKPTNGTAVHMKLSNHTGLTAKKIFDQYAPEKDDYGFSKTIIPVNLAQYDNDQLISRSQAKRLLTRIALFKTVVFDFTKVDFVGQAFADEIFRVFARQHPEIELLFVHANKAIKQMINRAKTHLS